MATDNEDDTDKAQNNPNNLRFFLLLVVQHLLQMIFSMLM
jgi:hypothetical protein